LHRSWIWQDNLRLYTDTVAKSPTLFAAKVELASALMGKGREAEAQVILGEVQADSGGTSYVNADINQALILFNQGKIEEARALLFPLLNVNPKKHYDLLQHLLRINDQRIGRVKTDELRLAIRQESLGWLKEQQHLRPSAFTLYRIGKMQLSMGDKPAALSSFRSALEQAPSDAYYRGAMKTFIQKLEGL
jgi:tetratricopeptide (TPR) repeat protein